MFLGYHDYWSFYENYPTQSLQSGVACFCKYPARSVARSFEEDKTFDTEGRLLILEFNHFFFVNVYVPNSQDEISGKNKEKPIERRRYRKRFDELLKKQLISLDKQKPVIVCGDFTYINE